MCPHNVLPKGDSAEWMVEKLSCHELSYMIIDKFADSTSNKQFYYQSMFNSLSETNDVWMCLLRT